MMSVCEASVTSRRVRLLVRTVWLTEFVILLALLLPIYPWSPKGGSFPPSPESSFVHRLTLEFFRRCNTAQDLDELITQDSLISLAEAVAAELGIEAKVSPVGNGDAGHTDDAYLLDYVPLSAADLLKAEDTVVFAVKPPRYSWWRYVDETGLVRPYTARQTPRQFSGRSASALRDVDFYAQDWGL